MAADKAPPIKCVWEHNGNDTILYSADHIGAFTRGANLAIALSKMQAEIKSFCDWSGQPAEEVSAIEIIQDCTSALQICDADSDVLFDTEKPSLTSEEYQVLKLLVLKSAEDFHRLYLSIPDKHRSCLPRRQSFYGGVPRTAQEMYDHTKNVNAYYFAEIGIDADNAGTIFDCRKKGFALLEQTDGYLLNQVFDGSYDELWNLRKVMRRFLWHDRIHARAMYRMAIKTFGELEIENVFHF